jgi:LacI family transcriptional regulator
MDEDLHLPPAGPGITIRDVARAGGVSVATVSRALNGGRNVRPETRARILQVVERVGYVPHGGARSLITRQTRTVGVLLPDLHGEFFSELIRGVDLAARRRGYHLLVSGSHSDRSEIRAVLRALRGRVDGLVVMSPDIDAPILRENLPADLPVVLVGGGDGSGAATADTPVYDVLEIDNRAGASSMVRHLAALGHRRIAFIAGPPGNHDAQVRLAAYRETLGGVGAEAASDLVLAGDFTQESGYQTGRRLLGLRPRPTAVFAANDAMAIGCLAALREAGVRVPAEVALAGFDDVPIARYLSPPLTTVRVGISELGATALDRLLLALAGERPTGGVEILPTALVVRGSCGAAVQS